jgi:hypothetical protein
MTESKMVDAGLFWASDFPHEGIVDMAKASDGVSGAKVYF